jgi:hypothetical protein
VDYDTWETELLEDADIRRHVAAGSAVPIYIGSDGAFQMVVRVGSGDIPPVLSEREARYEEVRSEPYLLVSDGVAYLTGIEYVIAGPVETGLTVPLPAGRWSVVVSLIAWEDEPGARNASGEPGPQALSDFVLLIAPEGEGPQSYRQSIETFG